MPFLRQAFGNPPDIWQTLTNFNDFAQQSM
jgi:hypothetical protein